MRVWIAIAALLLLAACESAPESPLPTVMSLSDDGTAQATATETETRSAAVTAAATATQGVQTLPFNQAVAGELAAGESDYWEFAAAQGDHLVIRAISEQVDLQLMLLDASGSTLTEGEIIETTIANSAVYAVRVTGIQGDGIYQLGLAYADRPAPAEPTFTPLPQIVGVPTPTPLYAGLGTYVATLRDGETMPSEFEPAAQPQVFTFAAQAGQYARVTLDPINGDATLLMTLYSPEAVPLASDGLSDNGNGILRDVRLPLDGEYSVRVQSDGQPGTYTVALDLREVPAPITPTYHITPTATLATPVLTPEYQAARAGERLSPDTPVLDEIPTGGGLNTHSFSVRAGDVLTVGVSPVAGSALVPRMEIVDPDGEPIATVIGDTSPLDRDAIASPLVAALDGPYTIFVTGEGATSGPYRVSFGYGSTRENIYKGEALPDRAIVDALGRRAGADVWYIGLTKGDLISAGVTPMDTNIVPVLEFYNGTGQLLGIDSQSAGDRSPLISGVRAPETGLYLLKVRPAQANTIGAYQLVWRYLDLGPTPTPAAGTLPILTIEDRADEGEYKFYPFQAKAGQKVVVQVRAEGASAIDPVAALIGPDGTALYEGDDSAGTLDAYFEATLPMDGTYQLRVHGYLSAGEFRATVIGIYQ